VVLTQSLSLAFYTCNTTRVKIFHALKLIKIAPSSSIYDRLSRSPVYRTVALPESAARGTNYMKLLVAHDVK